MMNDEQYKRIRGIIRGELAHFTCNDCRRNTVENYPCDCGMIMFDMKFKPTEQYIDKITEKIKQTIEGGMKI